MPADSSPVTRVAEVLHPRVSRVELPSGHSAYAKRPWPGAAGEALLRREAGLQRHASVLDGPHGKFAADPDLRSQDYLELLSKELAENERFDRAVAKEPLEDGTLSLSFSVGEQLAALHKSGPPAEGSSPEEPVLMPIPIEHFGQVPDSTIVLLGSLPTTMSVEVREHVTVDPRATCFIHGDFKPDNIFASTAHVVFIDWERAGSGDPLHDVAAFIAGIMSIRLSSVGLTGLGSSERSREALTSASVGSWGLAAAFLHGYQLDASSAGAYERLIGMTGAKLLARTQTAAHVGSPESPHVRAALAVVSRLVANPAPAATSLRNAVGRYARTTA